MLNSPRVSQLAGFCLGAVLSASALAVPGEIPYVPIAGAAPVPLAEQAGLGTAEELEIFLDGVMADQILSHEVVGAVVAVVKDGELFFVKGYGWADREARVPMDGRRHLVRPGSISKLFTWTALMQLVEQGRVDLEADVNDYLSAFQIPATFEQPITIRNLLTHTEGMEDGGLGFLMATDISEFEPLGEFLNRHMPARVRPPTTDFSTGGNASYSNWGTALAGLIIEEVSGQPFDDYVAEHIFAPLGMSRSTFAEPLPPALDADMAKGYHRVNGLLEPRPFELVHNFAPAGSMTAPAPDMARFMIAHLQGGRFGESQILRPETAALMHSRQFSPSPHVNGSGLGFYETRINGRRLIAHGGDTVAFHSDLNLLLDENVGLFVSYNSASPLPIRSRGHLLRAFMDRYYPAALPQVEPPADFDERAAQYAGNFRLTRHGYTTNEKLFAAFNPFKVAPTGRGTLLVASPLSTTPTEYVEIAPHSFRQVDGDATMSFMDGEDGALSTVSLPLAFIAAYRLELHETLEFHGLLLALALFGAIGAIVGWLRHRREGDAGARLARGAAALGGLVLILSLAGMGLAIADLMKDAISGFPSYFNIVLALFLVFAVLALVVTGMTVQAWRDAWFERWTRLRYSLTAAAFLAFVWSLDFWNLLGYHYG